MRAARVEGDRHADRRGARRRAGRALTALLLLAASPVLAVAPASADPAAEVASPAGPPPTVGGEVYFDAESWRALVEGKTLTYRASGGLMGREYYVPNSNRVVFVYFDGRCYDGSWTETDGVFCFAYDGEFCFHHLRRGGKLIAREMNGAEQIVTSITDETLACTPDLISRAPGANREDDKAS